MMATPLSVPSKTPVGPQPNTPTTETRGRRLSQSRKQSKPFVTCSLCLATRRLHSGGTLLHLHGHREEPCKSSCSGGASPLFVAGQSQVISRTRKGSQHIYYTSNVLRVLTFQILFIVSKTSKFRTCLTVIRNCTVVKHTSVFLHTYAIKLILSHRSNEVE